MSELWIKNRSESDLRSCEDKESPEKILRLQELQTCSRRGFIAQSVEHRTGIIEVIGPLEPQNFFWAFFVTACLSYLTTAKITFTSISLFLYAALIFAQMPKSPSTINFNVKCLSSSTIIFNVKYRNLCYSKRIFDDGSCYMCT